MCLMRPSTRTVRCRFADAFCAAVPCMHLKTYRSELARDSTEPDLYIFSAAVLGGRTACRGLRAALVRGPRRRRGRGAAFPFTLFTGEPWASRAAPHAARRHTLALVGPDVGPSKSPYTYSYSTVRYIANSLHTAVRLLVGPASLRSKMHRP